SSPRPDSDTSFPFCTALSSLHTQNTFRHVLPFLLYTHRTHSDTSFPFCTALSSLHTQDTFRHVLPFLHGPFFSTHTGHIQTRPSLSARPFLLYTHRTHSDGLVTYNNSTTMC